MTTHAQEKLNALRNAVVNVASGFDVEEFERQLFLRYVDELTVEHLDCLARNGWVELPADTLRLVKLDLINRGLFDEHEARRQLNQRTESHSGFDIIVTDNLIPPRRTVIDQSQLGERFLRFISQT